MIFEFWLNPDEADGDFLRVSGEVRKSLDDIEGFRSVERFESCSEKGKFVTIGFFDDEESVAEWRNHPVHAAAQALGKTRFFSNYRIRMANVVRDYGLRPSTGV